MHICVIYQHYNTFDCPASARLYTFLQHLGRTHTIDLITTANWKNLKITNDFPWVPDGVSIHEVNVAYQNKMSSLQRAWSYMEFPRRSFQIARKLKRPDVVLGISTPLTTGWAAEKVARFFRCPWVFEIRDLWPDFPIQMGALPGKTFQRLAYKLERHLYESSCHTVTVSPDMTAHVRGYGIPQDRVSTILQGTNLDFAKDVAPDDVKILSDRYRLGGKKVVLYAGTFGRANDIPNLLRTARAMDKKEEYHFVFLGHGYYEKQIREQARIASNITLAKPLPRHKIFPWFQLATLTLVSFADVPVLRTNSPAKFFDSLACSTPVIVTNNGWTKDFVLSNKCGWYVPANRAEEMATKIESICEDHDILLKFGNNGSKVAAEQFDRQKLATDLERILQSCSDRFPSPGKQ